MKIKNKLILSSLAVIAVAGGIAGGSTYALFTSNDNVNIAITSGKVQVKASLVNLTAQSLGAKKAGDTEIIQKTFTGDDAKFSGDYAWHAATEVTAGKKYRFENSGTVEISGNQIVLDKVSPGDKVNFGIKIENSSNIDIAYRVKFAVTSGEALMAALVTKIDNVDFSNVTSYVSDWYTTAFTEITKNIEIELPITVGNAFQGLTTTMTYSIEAVQANAYLPGSEHRSYVEVAPKTVTAPKDTTTGKYVAPATNYETEETTVSFNNGWYESTTDSSLNTMLTVDNKDKETAEETFNVAEGSEVINALDVNMYVDNNKVTTFNNTVVTIATNIGAGKSNVKVYYNNVDLKEDGNDNTDYTYYATATTVGGVDYAAGDLVITTDHFSDYVVTSNLANWNDVIPSTVTYASKDDTAKTITIATNEQLALLSKETNQGINYAGYTVSLTADVDMSQYAFTPIHGLKAVFDGANHTIKGMKIYATTGNLGFVDNHWEGSTIKDIVFDAAVIKSSYDSKTTDEKAKVGIVAANIGTQTISGITIINSEVNVPKGEHVGGITGSSYGTIENCTIINTKVAGGDQAGGFVGYQSCGKLENCKIENSFVTATYERAGGLFGKFQAADDDGASVYVKNCEVKNVTITCAEEACGGFAGQLMGDCNGYEIDNVYIDATLVGAKTNIFASLRSAQNDTFVSAINTKVTNIKWTSKTGTADKVTYTNGTVSAEISNSYSAD